MNHQDFTMLDISDDEALVRFTVWRASAQDDLATLTRWHCFGVHAVAYPGTEWEPQATEQPQALVGRGPLTRFVVTTKTANFERVRADLEDDPQIQTWTCGRLIGTGLVLDGFTPLGSGLD
jgi:hypothetical protein